MKIVVTGSSGFIGSALISQLARTDHTVLGVVRDSVASFATDTIRTPWDYHTLYDVFATCAPEVVVHLGEPTSIRRANIPFIEIVWSYLLAPSAIVQAALDANRRTRIVYIDSASTYGGASTPFTEEQIPQPLDDYGRYKRNVGELFLSAASMSDLIDCTVLRAGVVYGPGQRTGMLIPDLIRSLLSDKPFELTQGTQKRDFLFVEDLVQVLMMCLFRPEIGSMIMNVASGAPVTIKRLCERIATRLDKPLGLLRFGAASSKVIQHDYALSIDKIRRVLDWVPDVSLDTGIDRTVEWYQNLS